MKLNKKSIAIVGGGILGMTLALRLAERGFLITIIEADSELGGLLSSFDIGGYKWDKFYHVLLQSDKNLINLLVRLGLDKEINWGKTKTGFFIDRKSYSFSDTAEFLSFPPLSFLDKLRLGWTIFYASKIRSSRKIEKISAEKWLTRVSGKQTFNKIWLPLLKSKLGENYRDVNASFIQAVMARMYVARSAGQKRELFGYVKSGYAHVINQLRGLLEGLGVEILCGFPVTRIKNNSFWVEVEKNSGEVLEFDNVIFTIPCSKVAHVCPQLSHEEKKRLQSIKYQGILCASVLLKSPLSGCYITNITDESIPFTAVIEMTALVDNGYFDGNTLVYLPRYLTSDDPFWEKSDEEIRDEFFGSLKSMYPVFHRDELLCFKIEKVREVLPLKTLNYSVELLPPTKTSLDRVYIVNSAQIENGTLNVNETVGFASRKAKEISLHLSQ